MQISEANLRSKNTPLPRPHRDLAATSLRSRRGLAAVSPRPRYHLAAASLPSRRGLATISPRPPCRLAAASLPSASHHRVPSAFVADQHRASPPLSTSVTIAPLLRSRRRPPSCLPSGAQAAAMEERASSRRGCQVGEEIFPFSVARVSASALREERKAFLENEKGDTYESIGLREVDLEIVVIDCIIEGGVLVKTNVEYG
ncbi:hypothetical protein LR48_Vigan10g185300 [Vigna angularis]|uniref:Uncharacterized protein n=1 Tax=Phaseolus angularis TaxID=3914 RepID=A0A0L9VLP8_PHAAN|nr:hypothetical protein LR48_Vigan10g185300 [Vigna angularis]